jgi:hypothetical protein
MSAIDTALPPDTTTPPAPPVGQGLSPGERPTFAVVLAALVVGGLAGLASWGVGEWAQRAFAPTFDMPRELRASAVTSTVEAGRQKEVALRRTATVSYGTLGAALGLSLGLVGGYASRSYSRGRAAAAFGGLLGGTTCGAAAWAVIPAYLKAFQESQDNLSHDLMLPLIVHGGMWLGAGLAAGLALGLGRGGWRRAGAGAVGGSLGAVLGTLAYELLGGAAFPLASTTSPIPTSPGARALAHLGVALLAAGAAAVSSRPERGPAGRPGPATGP